MLSGEWVSRKGRHYYGPGVPFSQVEGWCLFQVVSCCLGCIAHSANDTANAIGPFAALVSLHGRGVEGLDTPLGCPWYILFFGGLSMSLGLALLGYRVIKTVGVKLVNITPARGFAMELGAGWVGRPQLHQHSCLGRENGLS